MIRFEGVGHEYNAGTPWAHRALRGIDVSIGDGECILVIGPNGAGKSTLAWVACGLIEPTEGRVLLDGSPIATARGRVAITFQHSRLQLFRPTVGADVRFGTDASEAEVRDALGYVGLDARDFWSRRIDELSGGEQRRVALAGMLIRKPRLLVLDEPFAGLDPLSRGRLVDVLSRLHADAAVSAIVISQDLEEADRFADRLVGMADGGIVSDPLAAMAGGRLASGRPIGSPDRIGPLGPTRDGSDRTPARRPHVIGRGRARRGLEPRLFRYVPGESPAHRMWAGTKLVALTALSVAVGIRASWAAEAVLAGVLLLFAWVAHLPRGVAPRVPRWLWIGVLLGAAVAVVSGGAPSLHVGPLTLGMGGLLRWLRFTALAVLVALMSALIGWTTRLADIAPAVERLAAPLRLVRVPVDELVLAVGLSVRSLPLLGEEIRTIRAAWQVRGPVGRRRGFRGRDLGDVLSAALVSSVRRAREMAEAIEARGGPRLPPRSPLRLHLVDAAALILTTAAVLTMARV